MLGERLTGRPCLDRETQDGLFLERTFKVKPQDDNGADPVKSKGKGIPGKGKGIPGKGSSKQCLE